MMEDSAVESAIFHLHKRLYHEVFPTIKFRLLKSFLDGISHNSINSDDALDTEIDLSEREVLEFHPGPNGFNIAFLNIVRVLVMGDLLCLLRLRGAFQKSLNAKLTEVAGANEIKQLKAYQPCGACTKFQPKSLL